MARSVNASGAGLQAQISSVPENVIGNKSAVVARILTQLLMWYVPAGLRWSPPADTLLMGWDELLELDLDQTEDLGHFIKTIEPQLMWHEMMNTDGKLGLIERIRESAEAIGFWLIDDERYVEEEGPRYPLSPRTILTDLFYTIGFAINEIMGVGASPSLLVDPDSYSDSYKVTMAFNDQIVYRGGWTREDLLHGDFHMLVDSLWDLFVSIVDNLPQEVKGIA